MDQERVLTIVSVYEPITCSEYPPFLDTSVQVLEGAPTGGYIVLPENFNTHMSNDSVIRRVVIGRGSQSDWNLSYSWIVIN